MKLKEKLIKDITFYIEQKGAIGISLDEMIDTILKEYGIDK